MKIKFKVWDRIDKDMIDWVTLSQSAFNRDGLNIVYDVLMNHENRYAHLLYSLLNDMYDKEICEGDILKARDNMSYKFSPVGVVQYDSQYGGLIVIDCNSFYELLTIDVASDSEIIGNIYENPELLESENVECQTKY